MSFCIGWVATNRAHFQDPHRYLMTPISLRHRARNVTPISGENAPGREENQSKAISALIGEMREPRGCP